MAKEIADIYVRLSTEDRNKKHTEDESESIQNQKTMLINYCMKKGWQINGIYSDEDYSGADAARPAWNSVLKDCESGKCTVVVCKTQSRFSRDMEMIEHYLHGKFCEWGVRFVSVVDNADTSVKANKKARQINGLINEWYLEDLSENIKSTLSTKRKSGKFVGSFAPYGYLVDENDKNHLVVDRVAAPIVKRIFNMYIRGLGYVKIANVLNSEGIPPPCVRKKDLGSKYYNGNYEKNQANGGTWSDASVAAILKRQVYTGALVQGVEEVINFKTGRRRKKPKSEWDIVDGRHEAIISKETFLLAEKMRLARGKGQKNHNSSCYSLAKKVFCGECGSTMWKVGYNQNGKSYNYLCCKSRKEPSENCDNIKGIRLDELEKTVLNEINKLLYRYYDKNIIGEFSLPKKQNGIKNDYKKQIKELKSVINRNKLRIEGMYCDKLDGIISVSEFTAYKEKWEKESAAAKTSIKKLEESENFKTGATFSDLPDKYRKINTLTFEIADMFIDKIYVGKIDSDNKREIKVEWKI